MSFYRSYKVELDLNNKQVDACRKGIGVARFAWNWGWSQKQFAKSNEKKIPSYIDLGKLLNTIKDKEFPWLREVSSLIPEAAFADLEQAFANFFAKRARYPKLKTKRSGLGCFRLRGAITATYTSIKLPRLGFLQLKETGYIPTNARILSATVSTKAGRWFVSVMVEEKSKSREKKDKYHTVGVDLGIKTLASVSDGQTFENHRALQKRLRKLRRLNQALSRKQKGSQNRKKAIEKIQKLHWRIDNIRNDSLHKLTTHLAKTKRCVVIEDLNVRGMLKNRKLSRAIADVGFYEFKRQLLYKAEWYNCKVVIADRFFPSSKTCSCCGQICDYLTLDIRKWKCLKCKTVHDRDLNAAKNLENVAAGLSETKNACGEKSSGLKSCTSSETSLSEARMKQKSKRVL